MKSMNCLYRSLSFSSLFTPLSSRSLTRTFLSSHFSTSSSPSSSPPRSDDVAANSSYSSTSHRSRKSRSIRPLKPFRPRDFPITTIADEDKRIRDQKQAEKAKKESAKLPKDPQRINLKSMPAGRLQYEDNLRRVVSDQKKEAKEKAAKQREREEGFHVPIGQVGFSGEELDGDLDTTDPDLEDDNEDRYSILRVKRQAREAISRELYEMSVDASHRPIRTIAAGDKEKVAQIPHPHIDLRRVPFHIHRLKVSRDLQFITACWCLEPNVPHVHSRCITLPDMYRGHTLQTLLEGIAAMLTRSIRAIRFELGNRLSLKYVPHLRYVHELKDQQRTEQVLSSSHSIDTSTSADEEEFLSINPFQPPPKAKKRDAVKKKFHKMPPAMTMVSEIQPGARKRTRHQQHLQQLKEEKIIRITEGMRNGKKMFATNMYRSDLSSAAKMPLKTANEKSGPKEVNELALRARQRVLREREIG